MDAKNNEPLVSVIMATFNEPRILLTESIESILNQTYRNFELIILDDSASEDTISTIDEFAKMDSRIVVVRKNSKMGFVNALNEGIKRSKGEFIARMDGDDISLNDRFSKQLAFFKAHPNVEICGGAIIQIDENGKGSQIIKYPLDTIACRDFFKTRDIFAHPTVMYRKEYFTRTGCMYRQERWNEDTMMWYDALMNNTEVANLEDVILKFRVPSQFYTNKRCGYKLGKYQLKKRLFINKNLHYGFQANLYAYCMFILMISPAFVRKIAYKVLR
jgi:glycosyltransferase involved in cell wall biosynthesis